MGLQNVSSGRIDAAVFLLTYAIGKIAFRRASGIGWDIGHRFLLGGGSHGLTVVEGVLMASLMPSTYQKAMHSIVCMEVRLFLSVERMPT